ncbi:nucleotide exchange factor GrpE [Pseudonocardia sp. CNS-139]|nr:nucleotide exchange factor GrpE [Pseudonocardia sp. CNS-139]
MTEPAQQQDSRPAEIGTGAGPTAAELEDRWRRAAADLDNTRKRHARELAGARQQERARVAGAFLPVLDDVDRALEHAGPDPLAEGVRAVRDGAVAVLAGLGYRRDDATGVPFDPSRHEVVGVVDADAAGVPPGAVAAVVRPGYGGPDGQLRAASVLVAQQQEDRPDGA